MEPHAQEEIRSYAATIGNEIVGRWCPIAWFAFQDYLFGGIELSKFEIELIAKLQAETVTALDRWRTYGIVPPAGQDLKRNIERDEIEEKLRVSASSPWSEA